MRAFAVFVVVLACAVVRADHLILESGHVYEGQILQDNDDAVTFRLDHGVIVVPKSVISTMDHIPPAQIEKPAAKPDVAKPAAGAPAVELPSWEKVTTELARQTWATNLTEIPATVIDKGQMRYVPYSSYRCGLDYEVNIYGDPDAPAGVEIGVYRDLLNDAEAKQRCVDFISGLLNDKLDASIARTLDKRKDLKTHNGLTIEITPPTAEDAYGGWWISIYDTAALDAARATPQEVEAISVAKDSLSSEEEPPKKPEANKPAVVAPVRSITEWRPQDIRYARPSHPQAPHGGRVYVRGFHRVQGRYIVPHPHPAPAHLPAVHRGGGRK